MVLAFSKQKWKKTQEKHINFNINFMMWLQKAVCIITIIKLQLRWLFRGPAPVRLQPGETFPRNKACSSLQPCQPIQQFLSHTKLPVVCSCLKGRHILTSPTAQSHPSAAVMRKATNAFSAHTRNHQAQCIIVLVWPQGGRLQTVPLLRLLWWGSLCCWVNC